MSALVEVRDGAARASSLVVAEKFRKRHDHVMRTIRELLNSKPDLSPNFGEMIHQAQIGKGGRRSARHYDMDRKGFMLLVMGFTGPKALDWKIAFIDAFDRMEAALHAPPPMPMLPAEEPGMGQDMLTGLQFVREARLLFGREEARRLWERLGLPEVRRGALPGIDRVSETVAGWIGERLDFVDDGRETTAELMDDYAGWMRGRGVDFVPTRQGIEWFGRELSKAGLQVRYSNGAYRLGIKLKN